MLQRQKIKPVILRARDRSPKSTTKPLNPTFEKDKNVEKISLSKSLDTSVPRAVTLLPKELKDSDADTIAENVGSQYSIPGDCVELVSDNVSIVVNRNTVGKVILIRCTMCNTLESHSNIGNHLHRSHGIKSTPCSGVECGRGYYSTINRDYGNHIEQHHSMVLCGTCDGRYDARRYKSHMATHGVFFESNPSKFEELENVETEIGPNSITFQPKIVKSQTLITTSLQEVIQQQDKQQKGPLIRPPPPPVSSTITRKKKKRDEGDEDGNYFFDGDIVIVDRIHYLIKDFVIFVDCPFCDIACSLSVMGAHFMEDHGIKTFSCFAKSCSANVSALNLQKHFLEKHGSVKCRDCKWALTVMEVKAHVTEFCPLIKTFDDFKSSSSSSSTTMSSSLSTTTIIMTSNPSSTERKGIRSKIPTVACPYCQKQCSYLNKHIRDVHQPKISCDICGKLMGKSYLSEHMKIQHEGKEVPTKKCPLCGVQVQKVKNHFKYMHKLDKADSDILYETHFGVPMRNGVPIRRRKRKTDKEEDEDLQNMMSIVVEK